MANPLPESKTSYGYCKLICRMKKLLIGVKIWLNRAVIVCVREGEWRREGVKDPSMS